MIYTFVSTVLGPTQLLSDIFLPILNHEYDWNGNCLETEQLVQMTSDFTKMFVFGENLEAIGTLILKIFIFVIFKVDFCQFDNPGV